MDGRPASAWAEPGAAVVTASRGREAGQRLTQAVTMQSGGKAHAVELDLSAPASIERALDALESLLGDRPLGILVANAGLWPSRYASSEEGYEIAFATNVLGRVEIDPQDPAANAECAAALWDWLASLDDREGE